MSNFLLIILVIAGLTAVVFGADLLVDGSSGIARKAGISEFVIGLTIIGIGTSAPEMVVSFIGALQGNSDIAAGNIIGSNIFNVLLIMGLTALFSPIAISKENLRKDIPFNIVITLALIILGMLVFGDRTLTRFEGAFLVICFILYIGRSFMKGKSEDHESEVAGEASTLSKDIVRIIAGITLLINGGRLFVDRAVELAGNLGLSDKFIAITILAAGTSMPELVTSLVAVAKKKDQLALGNILGSNIFNILLILGGAAVISPVHFSGIAWPDLGILLLSSLMVAFGAYTGRNMKIGRRDGIMLLVCFAAYMTYLFINR